MKRKKWGSYLMSLFCAGLICLISQPVFGFGYQLRPIEEVIPGLRLKGFIECEFDFALHGNSHARLNLPKAESTFQKIQWLTELEAHYSRNPHFEFTIITQFLYDSAFDWDHQYRRSYRNSERKLKYYRKGEQILREFYVNIKYTNWNLRIGKQQVIWGRVDGAKIMDIICPDDSRELGTCISGGC